MKSEEEQSYRDERSSMERRFKHTIYYRSSPNDEVEKYEVLISMNFTLNQVVDTVLKKTPLHYDNSQCRIVTYLPSYNLVDTTFDGREEFRLDRLFSSQHAVKPLLLDVRSQTTKFESYPSEPIITKVLYRRFIILFVQFIPIFFLSRFTLLMLLIKNWNTVQNIYELILSKQFENTSKNL